MPDAILPLFQEILTQLRTIFDLIIQFETAQDTFYQAANEELECRNHFEQQRKKRTDKVPLLCVCMCPVGCLLACMLACLQ